MDNKMIATNNDVELDKNQVCSKVEHTANDGKIYNTEFYKLDAIIFVGYRDNSKKATEFRSWANEIIKIGVELNEFNSTIYFITNFSYCLLSNL